MNDGDDGSRLVRGEVWTHPTDRLSVAFYRFALNDDDEEEDSNLSSGSVVVTRTLCEISLWFFTRVWSPSESSRGSFFSLSLSLALFSIWIQYLPLDSIRLETTTVLIGYPSEKSGLTKLWSSSDSVMDCLSALVMIDRQVIEIHSNDLPLITRFVRCSKALRLNLLTRSNHHSSRRGNKNKSSTESVETNARINIRPSWLRWPERSESRLKYIYVSLSAAVGEYIPTRPNRVWCFIPEAWLIPPLYPSPPPPSQFIGECDHQCSSLAELDRSKFGILYPTHSLSNFIHPSRL